MSPATRRWLLLLGSATTIAMGAVVSSALGLADSENPNMDRLRSMPLEHRRRLAVNLHQFELLPRDQREAIHELDRQIQAADPEMRDRYRELARRYYNWVQTLPRADRDALRSGSTPERLEQVRALLAKSAGADRSETLDTALARGSTLNPLPFLDQVHLIRVWLTLDTSQRQDLERAAPAERVRRLEELGQSLGVDDERPDFRRRAEEFARDWMSPRGPGGEPFAPGALRRFEALKAQSKGEYARRLMEYRVLSNTPLKPVEPAELSRLANALPAWIRQSLDALPPDAARARLQLIYRSLWPSGAMPANIPPWILTTGQSHPGGSSQPAPPPGRRTQPPSGVPGAPF